MARAATGGGARFPNSSDSVIGHCALIARLTLLAAFGGSIPDSLSDSLSGSSTAVQGRTPTVEHRGIGDPLIVFELSVSHLLAIALDHDVRQFDSIGRQDHAGDNRRSGPRGRPEWETQVYCEGEHRAIVSLDLAEQSPHALARGSREKPLHEALPQPRPGSCPQWR